LYLEAACYDSVNTGLVGNLIMTDELLPDDTFFFKHLNSK
jgi:hypothetical protein